METSTEASSSDDTGNQLFRMDGDSEPGCGSETEPTDPDVHSPRAGHEGTSHQEPQYHRSTSASVGQPSGKMPTEDDLRCSLYEDPPDNTDEDLSDVASDYGVSSKTKKLKSRAKDRWQR